MQTKNTRHLELRHLVVFVSLFVFFPFSAWSAPHPNEQASKQTTKPKMKEKGNAETSEERAKVNQALTTQERGKPIRGNVIQKPLTVNSQKTLTKKLETHPPKQLSHFSSEKPEVIKQPLIPEPKRSLMSKKPLIGDKRIGERKSRFKPDSIKQPLVQTGK